MGVDLVDILIRHEIKFSELKGRAIAIDAYNTLYQFLSIIRQPDGTPLMDSHGRITSYLSGLLYRTSNYMAEGIKPIYVFDGRPPNLKMRTLDERMRIRRKAQQDWLAAKEIGNEELAMRKAQQTSVLTKDMVNEAKKLLDLMGVPWVQAPSEGEAQAAYIAMRGDTYASASQDYDSLLFGTPILIRNMAITGRRKLPRKRIYVEVRPEKINLKENLQNLGVSREQLVDMGILVGTDYNPGIKGIGPKTALKLIKKHGNLEAVMKARNIEIPDFEEIRNIFLNPPVEKNYQIEWRDVNEQDLIDFMCGEHDFSVERVKSSIEKMRTFKKIRQQKNLDAWF